MMRWAVTTAAALALSLPVALPVHADAINDYPTAARADYVFGCMATTGGTRESLQRCSCAIDVIASLLPYSKYQEAETVLSMRRNVGGHLAAEFRSAVSNDLVHSLEEAEAEAEVRCF
jgi:hypothetical protein